VEEKGNQENDTRITLNKATINIRETEEDFGLVNIGENRPLGNNRNIIKIHGNAVRRDDKSNEA
jgi:hypothetical protein